MKKALLDFRKLLKLLAGLYGENEFDSRTVAEDLSEYFSREIDDPEVRSRLLERVKPKLISNDLRRLYTMGFLRRREVPRECKSKKGKRYSCGFKYMYSINNQGWSYLRKLVENEEKHSFPSSTVEELREFLSGLRFGMMKLNMVTAVEKGNIELAKSRWVLYRNESEKKFQSRGFRRFTRKRELFEMDTNCWMNMMYLAMKISSLENEIRARDDVIRELRRELEACAESKRMSGELLEGSKTSGRLANIPKSPTANGM
ncbi:hypothetical protein [Thermococcus sp.]